MNIISIIVPSIFVKDARIIAAALSSSAHGMFDIPLYTDGQDEPTHYYSHGYVADEFSTLLTNPNYLYNALIYNGTTEYSLEQCTQMLASVIIGEGSDISVTLQSVGLNRVPHAPARRNGFITR